MILVVVDTNQWFHSTQVLPGDLSITIGAEYDWQTQNQLHKLGLTWENMATF